MKWINTKGVIIFLLVALAIVGGAAYICEARNNWRCATREIDFLYSKLESSKIADEREKYQALNEIIENKNAIDETYFDALSGGFFAVSVLISIASLLSGLKFKEDEKRKLEEQKQSFKMDQDQFDKAIDQGALRIDVSSSSNVEFSDSSTIGNPETQNSETPR